jgi:general stress protein 26
MSNKEELKDAFFDALKSDRTLMLGIDGVDNGHTRPMTAQTEDRSGRIWFFSGNDNLLVQQMRGSHPAIAAFSSKGHDVFASLEGALQIDNDRDVIDRLWSPFVAAWYTGGKDDPNLALLRLDATSVEVWRSDLGLLTGIKMMLGMDVKQEFSDDVAEVDLGRK